MRVSQIPSESPRRVPLWACVLSCLALLSILALSAATPGAQSFDRGALLMLGLLGFAAWLPVVRRFLDSQTGRDAATWLLFGAMCVVYALARRAGPDEGWSLHLAVLPDSPIVVPYAARIVFLGALLSVPAWGANVSPPLKALLAALALVSLLGLIAFFGLRTSYPVSEVPLGERPVLNPRPLVETLMQSLEYASLALICAGATAHATVRRMILGALPLLLLVWARHNFAPVKLPDD